MSNKLRKVVAIIALVLMILFSVSLVLSLLDLEALRGKIEYVAMFCGGFGIALFFVLKFIKPSTDAIPKIEPDLKEKDDAAKNDVAPDVTVSKANKSEESVNGGKELGGNESKKDAL